MFAWHGTGAAHGLSPAFLPVAAAGGVLAMLAGYHLGRRSAALAAAEPTPGLLPLTAFSDAASRAAAARSPALIMCSVSDTLRPPPRQPAFLDDVIIHATAERLPALLPPGAIATRAGRDIFMVLVPEAEDPVRLLDAVRSITGGLSCPIEAEGLGFAPSAHAGIALAPRDGTTLPELRLSAELALAAAREQRGPAHSFFSPDFAASARRRAAVQQAVDRAVRDRSFRLEFQPVFAMRGGALCGFEALIRLEDPELGAISPAEFIPVAEEAGLIVEISAWALDEACRVAAPWPDHLVVAVNLSPSDLHAGTLVNTVRQVLEKHGLPAYRLEVEITEGTLMGEREFVLRQLRVLRDMGVALALDDFGTGYSSLGYLWKFPFSKLKIDRSFVIALEEFGSARDIIRSIVKLGHGLGMTVTAEGIESPRQLATLRDAGCDLAQGYLLGRPQHLTDIAAVIMRNFADAMARNQQNGARPPRTSLGG